MAVEIISELIQANKPFDIQILVGRGADIVFKLEVDDSPRAFSLDGDEVGKEHPRRIPGGIPKEFTISGWGSADPGATVRLIASRAGGGEETDEARVG